MNVSFLHMDKGGIQVVKFPGPESLTCYIRIQKKATSS